MERLTALAHRAPRTTLLIAALLAAAGTLGIAHAPLQANASTFLGADHPEVREFEGLLRDFGGGYALTVAWSCGGANDPCQSVFDESSLQMADALHGQLAAIPGVARISSPARTPLLVAGNASVIPHRFVQGGEVRAPAEFVEDSLRDPLWAGVIVARDGSAGALVVELASAIGAEQLAAAEAVENALPAHAASGFHFRLSGLPWLQVVAHRGSHAETWRIGVLTSLIVFGLVFALLRSLASALAVTATIALASVCSIGAVGALGWQRDPLTTGAPALVLAMGAADAIHMLACYWRHRRSGAARERALLGAARETARPCALVTLGTSASLLAFAGSGSPALAKLGVIAALGVVLCLLLTYSLAPALIAVLPDSRQGAERESVRWNAWLTRATHYPARFTQEFIGAATLLASIAIVGAVRLAPDSNALDAWREGARLRTDVEFVSSKLHSLEAIEVEVNGTAPLHDPQTFGELVRVEEQLARIDGVTGTRSLRAALDRAAPILGADRANAEIAHGTYELVSRSVKGALQGFADVEMSRARISLALPNLHNAERARVLAEVDGVLDASAFGYAVTGTTPIQLAIDTQMKRTAFSAALLSAAVVFALVAYAHGSWRWGALALIPNIPPVLVLYGLMGYLEMPHDYGAAILPPLVLAIASNDTIRILSAFHRERWYGHDAVTAIRNATHNVGHGLVVSGLVLTLAFLAMVPSEFQTLADAAGVSAIAVLAAIAAELTLLPALISRLSQSRPELTKGTRRDAPTH